MNREQALDKIKKCMALGKSAEPHEAAAALRQAQKLMQQFGLSDQDVSLADVREAKSRAASVGAAKWEVTLVDLVARSLQCEFYSVVSIRSNDVGGLLRRREYVFVGLDAAADMATYAFSVLLRQCVRARLAHIRQQPKQCKARTKTARGDLFALGWVEGVKGLLKRFAEPVRNRQLLLDYMQQRHPDLKTVAPRDNASQTQDRKHFAQGWHRGRQAELNRAVGAAAGATALPE